MKRALHSDRGPEPRVAQADPAAGHRPTWRWRTGIGPLWLALLCGSLPSTVQAQVKDLCLSDPKCAELNEAARNLSKDGQLDAALILYQTAYRQRPAAWLLVNIGRLQQKLYRIPDAIHSYRQYLASADAKDDPELSKKAQEYLQQAEANPKSGQTEQKLSTVDVCLTEPKCAELSDTARMLSKSGQLAAALTLYQNAYAMRPASWLLVNIGRTQQKLERFAEAIASYRQYLASDDSKEDPELTKKAQEYLQQAETEFEPPPAALTPPPPPPPPPPPQPGDEPSEGYGAPVLRQKQSGFAVLLGLGSRRPVVQIDATTTAQTTSIGGSLALGFKFRRLIISVGFELDYFDASTKLTSPAGSSTTSATTTSYLVTPGLQLALWRVAAGRLELVLAAQAGLGQANTSRTHDPAVPITVLSETPSQTFHVNYQAGLGIRAFVMPRLALSLTTGAAGDHFFAAQDSSSGVRTDRIGSVSLFGNLGMLAIF